MQLICRERDSDIEEGFMPRVIPLEAEIVLDPSTARPDLAVKMASVCISNSVNDARAPVRATYVNIYKWPESDAAFVRSVSSNSRLQGGGGGRGHPTVVDSISCRQLYLRSYTFSRKESVPEKTKKCLERIKKTVVASRRRRKPHDSGGGGGGGGGKKCVVSRRAKQVSCAALASIFRRLLSCTTKIDVVD
ncbi:unnamed protein product [Ilex paraguariensis]|uniref:Uncharacterized protein n=1 Tax=Ilex paraguariensis TaxID=185542 RepID=A0ABC8TIA9_9AQUA